MCFPPELIKGKEIHLENEQIYESADIWLSELKCEGYWQNI